MGRERILIASKDYNLSGKQRVGGKISDVLLFGMFITDLPIVHTLTHN